MGGHGGLWQVSKALNLDTGQKLAACKLRSIFLGKLQQILVDRKGLHAAIADSLPHFMSTRHIASQNLKARTS